LNERDIQEFYLNSTFSLLILASKIENCRRLEQHLDSAGESASIGFNLPMREIVALFVQALFRRQRLRLDTSGQRCEGEPSLAKRFQRASLHLLEGCDTSQP
jgi:hypothetical protein